VRAKIIQYNSTEGTGIAVAEGQQYEFNIRLWRSNTAPATGQTVEITLEGEAITAVSLVSAEVLAKERASQLASGLSAQLSAAGAKLNASAQSGGLGKGILQLLPVPALVAYVVFVLSATVFDVITMNVFGMKQGFTMWNASQFNIGGIQFLLILAFLSIIVPIVWQDKRAWFVMLLPLLPLLKLWYGFSSLTSGMSKATQGFGMDNINVGALVSEVFSIGLGGYGATIAALFLAGYGLKRALLPSAA